MAVASPTGSAHVLLTPTALWVALCVWSCLEVGFYFLVNHIIHPRLEPPRQAPQGPIAPRECLARLVDALERLKGVYPPERFWSGWFRGAPFEAIRRENVKEFLCWAIWHVHAWELTAEADLAALEEGIQALERVQGRAFPPGHNPAVGHVAFTREPIAFSHRALFYYVVIKLAQLAGHTLLRLRGHRRHTTRAGLTYWHRPCQQPGPLKQPPLLFFHGISPGVWFYLPFLARLGKGREVVLLEVPHIVTQLAFEAPDVENVVAALGEVFERHGIQHCAVAGHSFGSIVAGWAAASFPERVQQLVLIDPVCLLLCLPDVAVNFLYRSPPANILKRSVKDLVDPSSEITVAHALRRHFWWYQKVVWLQDVKCHVVVALSSEDDIVPSPAIRAYVARHYGLPDPSSSTETATAHDADQQQSSAREHRGSSTGMGMGMGTGGLSWGRRRGRWAGSAWAVLRNPRRRIGAWRTLFHRPSQAAAREEEGLPDARLIYWEGLGHGAMLFSLAAQDRLFDAVDAQARDRGLARWEKPVVVGLGGAQLQQSQSGPGPRRRQEPVLEPPSAAAAAAAAVPEPQPAAEPSSRPSLSEGIAHGASSLIIDSSSSSSSSRIKRQGFSPKWRLPVSPFGRRRRQVTAA